MAVFVTKLVRVDDGWQSIVVVVLALFFAPSFRFVIAVAKHSYC